MSAYMCSPDTFDLIASFASWHRNRDPYFTMDASPEMPDVPELVADRILPDPWARVAACNADDVAAILWAENVRSLRARYGSSAEEMIPERRYTFRLLAPGSVPVVVILKSIHCLRYQSCEAEDYERTLAAQLLDRIEKHAISCLPGYSDAPWGQTEQQ
jgi:hypothetical protein